MSSKNHGSGVGRGGGRHPHFWIDWVIIPVVICMNMVEEMSQSQTNPNLES